MLLEFTCSNHKSIREKIIFSALAGKDTSHEEKIEKIANRTETEVIVSATIQDEEAKKSLAKYIIEE